MGDLDDFFMHETQVRRRAGTGPSGAVYGDTEPVKGFVDQMSKVVRGATGEEVVASSTVYYPAGTPIIPLGSTVTLPATFGGQRGVVVDFAVRDSGALGLPDHLEVNLA
ncbi:MAG TPA: hypothetical protein VGF17_04925 [Phytomonospora sp.]